MLDLALFNEGEDMVQSRIRKVFGITGCEEPLPYLHYKASHSATVQTPFKGRRSTI